MHPLYVNDQHTKQAAKFALLMSTYFMFGQISPRRYDDPLDGIDIVKEHELIKQKKSGLSKRLRAQVEYRYNTLIDINEDHDGKAQS